MIFQGNISFFTLSVCIFSLKNAEEQVISTLFHFHYFQLKVYFFVTIWFAYLPIVEIEY